MASDSHLGGAYVLAGSVAKIVRHKSGALAGACGAAPECMDFLFEFMHASDPLKAEYCLTESLGMIVTKSGKIWLVECETIYPLADEYYSIGSGAPLALAAMFNGADAVQAIKTALHFDPGTSGDILRLGHGKAVPS